MTHPTHLNRICDTSILQHIEQVPCRSNRLSSSVLHSSQSKTYFFHGIINHTWLKIDFYVLHYVTISFTCAHADVMCFELHLSVKKANLKCFLGNLNERLS